MNGSKIPAIVAGGIVVACIAFVVVLPQIKALQQHNGLRDKGPRSITEERAVSSRTWQGIADEYLNVPWDKLVLAASFCIQVSSDGLRVEGQVPGTERYEVYGTSPSNPGGFAVVGLKGNAKMPVADAIAKFGAPSSVEDGGAVKRYFWGPVYLIASDEKAIPHGLGIDYRLYRETSGTFKETPAVPNRPVKPPQSTSAQEPANTEKKVDALIQQLKTGDDKAKIEAVIALRKLGPSARKALPALVEVLENRNVFSGAIAGSLVDESASAMAAIGGKEIAPTWLATFESDDPAEIVLAGMVLQHIGPEAIAPMCRFLTESKNPKARGALAIVLGMMTAGGEAGEHRPVAVSAIAKCAASDADPTVRQAALQALEKINRKQ